MAGQSAKKTAAKATLYSTYYIAIASVATMINAMVELMVYRNVSFASFGKITILSLVSYMSTRMILASLRLGVGFAYWQDLFVINTVVQILVLFSEYAWSIYLVVP